MAVTDAQIAAVEASITQLQQDMLKKVDSDSYGAILRDLDLQFAEANRSLAEITTSVKRWQGSVSVLRQQVNARRQPKTYAIAGGKTTYTVVHELGYKPHTQVLNSSDTVDETVTITHVSSSSFTVAVSSTSYTGTVLYF